MSLRDAPIGVFDSGFGGLNILAALHDLLPGEDLVYVGDSARSPYGSRRAEEVVRFSLEIGTWLVREAGVKMVVVGCNTASAVALEALSDQLPVPVIGVVGAGARAARRLGPRAVIGIIGTERTIDSGAYQRALGERDTVAVACPGLVELVEAGEVKGPRVEAILRERLAPIIEAKARGLLLGCTHYPYLARSLRRVLGPDVVLISPAEETAFDVREGLISLGLDNTRGHGSVRFWCTGDPEVFRRIGTRLYPEPLEVVEHLDLAVLASVWRASA